MKNTICTNTPMDHFVIESILDDGQSGTTLDELKNMGMEFNLTFHDDGTVSLKLGFAEIAGTWDDATITASDEDSGDSTFPYTLEGDKLTIDMGDGCAYVYRRSGETPSVRQPDSGKTVETHFDDLNQKSWLMTAVCPEAWYHHNLPIFDNTIVFTTAPNLIDETASQIKFIAYTKMTAKHADMPQGNPVKLTLNDKTWEGAHNKEENLFALYTTITNENGADLIVDVNVNGIEPEGELFRQVLESFDIKPA